MPDLNHEFLTVCVENDILMFGEFTLKSGRISPYFFNAGNFDRGDLLLALGRAFAGMLAANFTLPYMLYGPAYKGIPLAAATAVQLAAQHDINVPYAFNRKEAKDHGEGGNVVGAEISGRVMIIDDVITAGTAIREAIALIEALGADACAVCIALDRQERGQGQTSAIQELEQRSLKVISIIQLDHILEYLENSGDNTRMQAIETYRARYGIE